MGILYRVIKNTFTNSGGGFLIWKQGEKSKILYKYLLVYSEMFLMLYKNLFFQLIFHSVNHKLGKPICGPV